MVGTKLNIQAGKWNKIIKLNNWNDKLIASKSNQIVRAEIEYKVVKGSLV